MGGAGKGGGGGGYCIVATGSRDCVEGRTLGSCAFFGRTVFGIYFNPRLNVWRLDRVERLVRGRGDGL